MEIRTKGIQLLCYVYWYHYAYFTCDCLFVLFILVNILVSWLSEWTPDSLMGLDVGMIFFFQTYQVLGSGLGLVLEQVWGWVKPNLTPTRLIVIPNC